MIEFRYCAFCKKSDSTENLVQYSVRRYAHGVCLFERRGAAAIDELPLHDLRSLPVFLMAKAGYDVFAIVRRREREERRVRKEQVDARNRAV